MKRAAGFSLLEVIAAIMVLAITFGVLMEVAGGSIRLSRNAAEHTQASMWARTLLDTRFTFEPLKPGTSEGRFDSHYRWKLSVMPWTGPGVTVAPGGLRMYRIDLDVLWGAQPSERSAHFSTLRIGSASSPAQPL